MSHHLVTIYLPAILITILKIKPEGDKIRKIIKMIKMITKMVNMKKMKDGEMVNRILLFVLKIKSIKEKAQESHLPHSLFNFSDLGISCLASSLSDSVAGTSGID